MGGFELANNLWNGILEECIDYSTVHAKFVDSKGITTPSVKRQGPIGMHCDATKWVPDPFPSIMASVTIDQ